MKKQLLLLVLILAFLFNYCSFYLSSDMEDFWTSPYKIIFLVEPDSAKIVLNGRVIGEAYEFATADSALKLYSKDSDIVVKCDGYNEEVVNLDEFDSKNITIRLKLNQLGEISATEPTEPTQPTEPSAAPKSEYKSKSLIPDEEKTVSSADKILLVLEIEPEEAAIYIDGKFWGIAPGKESINNIRLKPGEYNLEVVKPGFEPYSKRIKIDSEKKLTLKIALQEK